MKKINNSLQPILDILLVVFWLLSTSVTANAKTEAGETKRLKMVHLNEKAKKILEENGFVIISASAYENMNDAYMAFRKNNLPIFVTTDSILHTTHVLFDIILRTIEINHLINDLKQLTESMRNRALDDYREAEDEKVKKAADSNIAFFSVAAVLLDEKTGNRATQWQAPADPLRLSLLMDMWDLFLKFMPGWVKQSSRCEGFSKQGIFLIKLWRIT